MCRRCESLKCNVEDCCRYVLFWRMALPLMWIRGHSRDNVLWMMSIIDWASCGFDGSLSVFSTYVYRLRILSWILLMGSLNISLRRRIFGLNCRCVALRICAWKFAISLDAVENAKPVESLEEIECSTKQLNRCVHRKMSMRKVWSVSVKERTCCSKVSLIKSVISMMMVSFKNRIRSKASSNVADTVEGRLFSRMSDKIAEL